MVTITEKAAEKVKKMMEDDDRSFLRVAVSGGGCSGFQYTLQLENEKQDGDQLIESNGVKLIVDPISSSYLKGAVIDFVDNLMGGGFMVKNPNAKSTCGCGQSFEA